MNWLCTCFKKVWMCGMLGNKSITIAKQITFVEKRIEVLKALEGVNMFKDVKERVPVYEAILETLKEAKKG